MPDRRTTKGRSQASFRRRHNIREVRQRFLIVCEGEKTEPNYIGRFRSATVDVKVLGSGDDPLNLVKWAIQLRSEADEGNYDQVWCVFDRDDVPLQRFKQAVALAEKEHIQAAYSNACFELWYLLHFQPCTAAIPRRNYKDKLTTWLCHPYMKNSKTMYEELLPYQTNALVNAERLLARYSPRSPADDNPSTTVHLLVQQLNKYNH